MVLKPMMAVGTTTVASNGGRQNSAGGLPSPGFMLGGGDRRPSSRAADTAADTDDFPRGGGSAGTQDGGPARRSRPDPLPQQAPPAASTTRYRRAALARTVVAEVVPRLVLAHREAAGGTAAASAESPRRIGARAKAPRVRAKEVAAFADGLLAGDVPAAQAVVTALCSRGAALEQVCLELMTPAARRMGQAWLDDRNDYTDVTLGMWQMQRILRDLAPVFQPQADAPRGVPRRACIVAVPGATHTFGADMVAGFLRLAGWEVCNEPVASAEELADVIGHGRFAVIGLSAGCAADLRVLAELIGLIRRACERHRPVGIMIGGSVLADEQGRRSALRIGADAVAMDAMHAVQQAEGLLTLLVKQA